MKRRSEFYYGLCAQKGVHYWKVDMFLRHFSSLYTHSVLLLIIFMHKNVLSLVWFSSGLDLVRMHLWFYGKNTKISTSRKKRVNLQGWTSFLIIKKQCNVTGHCRKCWAPLIQALTIKHVCDVFNVGTAFVRP